MEEETEIEGPGELLTRAFFERPPETVAQALLGKLLARRTASGWLAGRIVEAEAYLGPHCATPDPAAHAYRGPPARNATLFGPAGHAYIYSIYGMHFCMNISCEDEGLAGCVLLRALEPVTGLATMAANRGRSAKGCALRDLTSGPGRLCQALNITRDRHNGADLTETRSELQVRANGYRSERIVTTARIGIRKATDWPLRFFLADSGCVSGAKKQNA